MRLMLSSHWPSKKPIELRTSVARRRSEWRQISAIPGSPCCTRTRAGGGIERAVGGQFLAENFPAVIDAADEHELAFVADQDGALLVAHVEEEERFVGEDARVGELEGVEGADRRELEKAGRPLHFRHGFGNLFDRRAEQSADEIARLAGSRTAEGSAARAVGRALG